MMLKKREKMEMKYHVSNRNCNKKYLNKMKKSRMDVKRVGLEIRKKAMMAILII